MIVIHFGLRKAGSSSVQQFLKVNQNYLRWLGYDYAPIGHRGYRSHLNLVHETRQSDEFDPAAGTLDDLAAYWRDNPGKSLLISSEIFETSDFKSIKYLKQKLKTVDRTFLPILIIRDLVGLVASSYSQNAKVKGAADFDTFFDSWHRRRRTDYFRTAEGWARVFGWDRMRVRPLDRNFLLNGDLIDDFMATAQIELSAAERKQLKKPEASNVAPGWRVTEALRALYGGRHGLPDTHPLARSLRRDGEATNATRARAEEIGEARGWNADKGLYLTSEQAQICLDLYRRSVEALNGELPQPLPMPMALSDRGFVAREFLPDIDHIPAVDLRNFYDELGDAV